MRFKYFISIVMIFIFMTYFIYPNEKIVMDKETNSTKVILDEKTAVGLALANNLGIESEKIKFSGKVWNLATSWNTFLPTISMGASLSKLNGKQQETEVDFSNPADPQFNMVEGDDYEWSVGVNFNLQLNLNAAMGFQVYQTILDFQSGKISIENAKKKLELDVKKNLYNLILMQENILIMEESIENARKRFEQAEVNYNNGLVSEYTKLSAQVAYENLKPALLGMANGFNTALLSFKQMLGLKNNAAIEFNAIIETKKISVDQDKMISKNINNNLDLKSLDLSIKSLMNTRNIFISQLTPSISILYTMDPTFQGDAIEDHWFAEDSNTWDQTFVDDNWKQRAGMFSFAVSIPISDLIPFSSTQAQIIGYQHAVKEARIGYEQAKQGVELQIRTIVMSLDKSIKSIESLKLNINLAERAFNKAEEAYNAGSKEILEVQNSEIELKKAKLNLLQEEYNYTTGLLDLEHTLNTKLFN